MTITLNQLLNSGKKPTDVMSVGSTSMPQIKAMPVDLNKAFASGGITLANTTKPTTTGVKAATPYDTAKTTKNTITPAQTRTAQPGTNSSTATGIQSANPYNNTPDNFNQNPAPQPSQGGTTYNQNNNGLYGQIIANLANKSQQSGDDYKAAQAEAQRVSDQQTQLANDYAQKTNNIAGTAGFLTQQTGLQGQLQNQYNTGQNALANQYQGATNRLSAANTQQGLLQTALQNAGSLAAPQAYTPSQTPFNPANNQFTGGQTQAERAVNGANVGSAADLTTQKNQIQSALNGAEANFKLLVDTAKQGGVNDLNVPAINTIQQNFAKGLTSSSAVTNFRSTLAAVRSQYAQVIGGGTTTVDSQNRAQEAIPDNISLGALQSLEQQLKAEGTNRVAGIDNQVKSIVGGNTQSGAIQTNAPITWDSILSH